MRPEEEREPMPRFQRVYKGITRLIFCNNKENETRRSNQYRIPPRNEKGKSMLYILDLLSEKKFESFDLWLYRADFTRVILAFTMIFICFVTVFSFILHLFIVAAYEWRGTKCCTGYDFSQTSLISSFEFAFELSWTTFATVGYGVISIPSDEDCRGIRYVLFSEAFMGMLFSGFCTAIFSSKISRLNTKAQVTFSSALCLQYQQGVTHPQQRVLPVVSKRGTHFCPSILSGGVLIECSCTE
jgi:hypothetical protein